MASTEQLGVITRQNKITVEYEEMEGSPRAKKGPLGIDGTRVLKCAWADRFALAEDLTGWYQGVSGGTQLIRYLPQLLPGTTNSYATEVSSIDPGGAATQDTSDPPHVLKYEWAELTVDYAPPDGDGNIESLASESLEGVAEYIVPGGAAKQQYGGQETARTDALGKAGAPGMIVRSIDWIYNRSAVTNIMSEVFDLMGFVNEFPVASPEFGRTFEAETLLYHPPTLSREVFRASEPDPPYGGSGAWAPPAGSGISKIWSLGMRFTWRRHGWNKVPRLLPGATAFEWIQPKNAAFKDVSLYPQADFSPLFEFFV